MVDPISAACVAACAQVVAAVSVGNAATGIVGNRADWAVNKLLGASLKQLGASMKLPANHDLRKGLLSAHNRALAFTAETMSRQSRGPLDRIIADKIVALAGRVSDADAATPLPEAVLTPLLADRRTADQADLLHEAVETLATWLETETSETLPVHFRVLLSKSAPDGRAPWTDVLRLLVAEEIKTQPRFVNMLLAENVAEIAGHAVQVEAVVIEMQRGLSGLREELGLLASDVKLILVGQGEQREHNSEVSAFMAKARASGAFSRAAASGVSETAIRKIVERLGDQAVAREDLADWLDQWAAAALAERARRTDDGEALDDARGKASRKLREGLDRPSIPLMDLLKRERDEGSRRQLAVLDEAMRFDILSLDLAGFKQKLGVASRINAPDDLRGRATYKLALEVLRRDIYPWEWGATQNDLGSTLCKLGARESGTERLVEGIDALRLALAERTREVAPADWTLTQMNLGNALTALGVRQRDTRSLRKAVGSFMAALEVTTRERSPLIWAAILSNLGGTLKEIGGREAAGFCSGRRWPPSSTRSRSARASAIRSPGR